MSLRVIEGTWEEIGRHKAKLIGRRLRVTIQPEKALENTPLSNTAPSRHFSALGKYAFVAGGSEEFAQEKQAEIESEDRTRG